MSDDMVEDNDKPERTDSEWATLRRAEKRAKTAESQLADLQRELAFLKAGVDASDPRMRYFVKGYEGEADVDAIREAALEAGFLSDERPSPASDAAQAQARRTASLSTGATPVGDNSVIEASSRLEEAMASGGPDALYRQLAAEGIPLAEY